MLIERRIIKQQDGNRIKVMGELELLNGLLNFRDLSTGNSTRDAHSGKLRRKTTSDISLQFCKHFQEILSKSDFLI